MAGSQETSPARLTWVATQAAAVSRTVASVRVLGLVLVVPACLVSRTAADPEMKTSVNIALLVMMTRPRPARFRGRAGPGGDGGTVGGASGADGFGRRGSALVRWSCAVPRSAWPFV
jgi:hypothetical protein